MWSELFSFVAILVGLGSIAFNIILYKKICHHHPDQQQKRKPFRILLVRHGQSEAQMDPKVYKGKPDARILLTEDGHKMAKQAGHEIEKYIKKSFPNHTPSVSVWISPFLRTQETADEIVEILGSKVASVRVSPLLAEQDWGLFEGTGLDDAPVKFKEEWERCQLMKKHQGRFWARFPLGESCFDVCQRVQILFGSIVRELNRRENTDLVVVVSHGVTIRAFAMMWCHYTIDWFNFSRNPPNCSICEIESEEKGCRYIFGGWDKDISNPVSIDSLDFRIPWQFSNVRGRAYLIGRGRLSLPVLPRASTIHKIDPKSESTSALSTLKNPPLLLRKTSGRIYGVVEHMITCPSCHCVNNFACEDMENDVEMTTQTARDFEERDRRVSGDFSSVSDEDLQHVACRQCANSLAKRKVEGVGALWKRAQEI